ncbi:MAG: agmatine deiminase family protein [Alphaproteobacteria bacterium]|nr:agmatine deiminase family protein [Alphaproteobacteria bacterium]
MGKLPDIKNNDTPASLGYFFPPEFEQHQATWLSWPHNKKSWPGKIDAIYYAYIQFIKFLAKSEMVHINVCNNLMETTAKSMILRQIGSLQNIYFHQFPTNDAWCRDHGPAFLLHKNPKFHTPKIIVNWEYNAWGNKYPYNLDNKIPFRIANYYNIPMFNANIVMEGGSVEFNGKGTVITSSSCLLNTNRNPTLNKVKIETKLKNYYGVNQVLWVKHGIEGDDTDGHIDDTIRFVSADTVVVVVEKNKKNVNFKPLYENLKQVSTFRLDFSGKPLNIVELPMPTPIIYKNIVLPASYANFYICNKYVIVPTFRVKEDDEALSILSQLFKTREVIGIDAFDIIWGLGSFHCLSQQEPL